MIENTINAIVRVRWLQRQARNGIVQHSEGHRRLRNHGSLQNLEDHGCLRNHGRQRHPISAAAAAAYLMPS